MYDFNDAQPQMAPVGELIPDGTFARLRMNIRPGGINGATPADAGLLTASKSSDVKQLNCEFTVMSGPFAKRKFWQNYTVAGGKVDEKGVSKGWNVSKAAFRAMIDSALGLDPKDMSDAAKAKRTIGSLKQLDGITFVGRVMVEPASDERYSPQNKLANVVLPNEPQHAAVMRGEAVPAEPINAKPKKQASNAAPAPGWGAPAAPAAASDKPWAAPGVAAAPAQPAPGSGPRWLTE